jgi:hypothetical protein
MLRHATEDTATPSLTVQSVHEDNYLNRISPRGTSTGAKRAMRNHITAAVTKLPTPPTVAACARAREGERQRLK